MPLSVVKGRQGRGDKDEPWKTPPKVQPSVALEPLNPIPPEGRSQTHGFLDRLQVIFNSIKFWFHRVYFFAGSVRQKQASVYLLLNILKYRRGCVNFYF